MSSTDNLSTLRTWCGEHPWLVTLGVGGLIGVGALYRPQTDNERRYCDQLWSIWVEFVQLREDGVPPEQWREFAARVEEQMAPVVAELSEIASPRRPASRHLLWAARDSLPEMIREGPTDSRRAEQQFLEHLRNAEWYLKQNR